jgi:hypothetical protein
VTLLRPLRRIPPALRLLWQGSNIWILDMSRYFALAAVGMLGFVD